MFRPHRRLKKKRIVKIYAAAAAIRDDPNIMDEEESNVSNCIFQYKTEIREKNTFGKKT